MDNVAAVGGQALVSAIFLGLIFGGVFLLSSAIEKWRMKRWMARHSHIPEAELKTKWNGTQAADRQKTRRFLRWLYAFFFLALVGIVSFGVSTQ